MSKNNRSSQRRGRQMARTNKTITSNDSDAHLAQKAKLRKDSLIQTEKHTNKIRALKGLPPIPTTDPTIGAGTPDDVGILTLDDAGDEELVRDADLIVGLRDYSAGVSRSVDADSFVAIHRKIRRERFRYRDLNGKMGEVGEVLPRSDQSRADKTRTVPGVLKSIMVRLMPAEAQMIGKAEINRKDVESAMDETVAAFERDIA